MAASTPHDPGGSEPPAGGFLERRAQLDGKVAVVIGGGGGLGRTATLDLARAGVRVVVADRDGEALADVAGELGAAGCHHLCRQLDARDAGSVARLVGAALDRFGGIDVLVNVVGSAVREPFAESTPRHWEAAITANFAWVLPAIHAALPALRASSRGASIVNFSSIEAHRAAPGFAVYAAMKAALTSLTRTLAVELAPEGVRVNAIAPDLVVTPGFLRVVAADPDRATWEDTPLGNASARLAVPAGRRGRPEDVGSVVLFLASELSSYLTGQTLHPDGGALASSGWANWPGVGFRNVPPPDVVAGLAAAQDVSSRPPSTSSSAPVT